MANGSHARWYALNVRPKYESSVASRLRDEGVQEYLPVYCASTEVRGHKVSLSLPLFPGYVFCRLDLNTGPRLYNISGVIRILSYGKQPTALADSEIETVRRLAESSLQIEPHPCLAVGDKIHLVGGPLSGISGTLLRFGKKSKLVVSLPLLRRALAVTVPSEWVALETAPSMATDSEIFQCPSLQ